MAKKRTFPWIAAVLIAAGAVMFILGISDGEMRTVEAKAVRICLECIGIG